MKLRFHGNSVRLRLNQEETARLASGDAIEECVELLPTPLIYRIELSKQNEQVVSATYTNGQLCVRVPRATAAKWEGSDQVGIEGKAGIVEVLVEKDFQCLHGSPRGNENCFPNPRATD